MTALANKIIAKHANLPSVLPGDIVIVDIDAVYIQDGNSPTIRKLFLDHGFNKVFDPKKISVFFDHSVLPPNMKIANLLSNAEAFSRELNLNVYKAGEGISHIIALEENIFEPGAIVLGSDSHTCTGGVNNTLSLGVGASDIAAAMVSGKSWLRVPDTTKIIISGKPRKEVTAKDLILYMLSMFNSNDFLYQSIEYFGEWLSELPYDELATIANMTVELGGKCCFFPDRLSKEDWLRDAKISSDNYAKTITIDIEGLEPYIAAPHSPSNSIPIKEFANKKIDMIFVGSCTNGKLNDIKIIAEVLNGKKISTELQLIVTPSSKKIYLEALQKGYIEQIISAGGIITPPGCGSCLGTQGPIPADGMNILSTMNRNFLGRMGNAKSSIYLCSPWVAALSAIGGEIPDFSEVREWN